MNKLDSLLYTFLVEESNMSAYEFDILTEETKLGFANEIANKVLTNIKDKMASLDLTAINKTRGEIKNFINLDVIQETIIKLTNLFNNSLDKINPLLPKYLNEIIDSIKNLTKFSYLFKEAYRNKKTILILRYQSIILSIVSALSYLVSVSIDFKDANQLKIKDKVNVTEISPISSLIQFNKSVENGTFGTEVKDVSTLREFFVEYSTEKMSIIYEATDIISLLNTGINSFSNFFNNANRNSLILKAVGVVMLILSLRQSFYSLTRYKNNFSTMINHLKTFLNIQNIPSLSNLTRFITFNNKNVIEAESATKDAENEIKSENKQIITDVKEKPSTVDDVVDFTPTPSTSDNINTGATDIFADFNF